MGADNLVSFHRWRAWETLFRLMPIAVLDRPGYRLKARASRAAQRFASAALDETDAPGLPGMEPPAWTLLTLPLSSLSSTRLRGGQIGDARARSAAQGCESRKERGEEGSEGRQASREEGCEAGKARRQSHKEK